MTPNRAAVWIWYPGDFEIGQHLKVSLRRREHKMRVPAFWRLDGFYINVRFRKRVELARPERVTFYGDGNWSVLVDKVRRRDFYSTVTIPAGEHEICILIGNQGSVPSVLVQGETIVSDGTWEAWNYQDDWTPVGYWNLSDPQLPPSQFRLPVKEIVPERVDRSGPNLFVDFGKEVYASVKLTDLAGAGRVWATYGESVEEAMDPEHCVLTDECMVEAGTRETALTTGAFRYVQLRHDESLKIGNISGLFEYLPVEYRGAFSCSNERVNRIWEVARYTLHLNTREFILDGVKRDGWVWSGDAYQSFLVNYYVFFNEAVNRRTLTALRGKDPVTSHINTILDYSFYWFLGMYDYYWYTGDAEFLRRMYPRMVSLMAFCLGRRSAEGLMEGLAGDWVYIDWADFDHRGAVCAEQLLFGRSLEVMAMTAGLMGDAERAKQYASLAKELRAKLVGLYWNEEAGGLVSTRVEGTPSREITRHANIFAMLFDFLDETKRASVIERVLLNPAVTPLRTPYFRFYELAALCEAGQAEHVLKEMAAYWGGMLDLGATTFWEEYDPTKTGVEHYAMYGEPYDKSLCHAWGASPIYVLGRYFLGVRPLSPGYATFEVRPALGGLNWIQGTVPTPAGQIEVFMDSRSIRVKATAGRGVLRFHSTGTPKVSMGKVRPVGNDAYEVELEKTGEEYIITINAV